MPLMLQISYVLEDSISNAFIVIQYKYFIISIIISSLPHELFRIMFILVSWIFLKSFYLPLISNFITR